MDRLTAELWKILDQRLGTRDTRHLFAKRIRSGKLTRDENKQSHFGSFLVATRNAPGGVEVLIGLHKKSGQYLPMGGHLDLLENRVPETSREAAVREGREELNVDVETATRLVGMPFWISTTDVNNPGIACKFHYDIWYHIDVTDIDVSVCDEFQSFLWCTIDIALSKVTNSSVIEGLKKLKEIL